MPVFGVILIIEDCEGLSYWRDVLYLGECSVWICAWYEAFVITVRNEVSCLTSESCETFERFCVHHEIYIPIHGVGERRISQSCGLTSRKVFLCTHNKVRELATICLPWQHWTKALVWFDDIDISVFHSCVVVDLWQSLSEWHLLLSLCVLVCHRENVRAWIRAMNEH